MLRAQTLQKTGSNPSNGGSSDPYKKANYDAAYLLPHPFLPTQSTPHQMHHQKVAMPVAKCAKLAGGAKYVTRSHQKKNRDDINARTRDMHKKTYIILCACIYLGFCLNDQSYMSRKKKFKIATLQG